MAINFVSIHMVAMDNKTGSGGRAPNRRAQRRLIEVDFQEIGQFYSKK